jgi:hypothetical protein
MLVAQPYTAVSSSTGEIMELAVSSFSPGQLIDNYTKIDSVFPGKVKDIFLYIPANLTTLSRFQNALGLANISYSDFLKNSLTNDYLTKLQNKNGKVFSQPFEPGLIDFSLDSIDISYIKAGVTEKLINEYLLSSDTGITSQNIESDFQIITFDLSRVNIIPKINEEKMDMWIMDHFIPRQKKKDNQYLIDLTFSSKSPTSFQISSEILTQPRFPNYSKTPNTYEKFEGGNFLFGKNYMIAGYDFLVENYKVNSANYNSIEEYQKIIEIELCSLFNKKIIHWSGTKDSVELFWELENNGQTKVFKHQPVFHIDMYLTIAGEANGKELIFLAQTDISHYDTAYLFSDRKQAVIEMNKLFNETEKQLIDFQKKHEAEIPEFEIVRLPLILNFYKSGFANYLNRHKSYNNILLERVISQTNNELKLYVPHYIGADENGEPNQINYATINKQAFDTLKKYSNSLIDMGPYDYGANGSLHCITNVLYRKTEN